METNSRILGTTGCPEVAKTIWGIGAEYIRKRGSFQMI
jgi:hypothetical protein